MRGCCGAQRESAGWTFFFKRRAASAEVTTDESAAAMMVPGITIIDLMAFFQDTSVPGI